MGLNLTADAQLLIEALMAPHLLQQQFVFNRHSGLIRHQLHMPAAHFTPGELGIATEHIQTPALTVLGHHGGAKQLHIP